MTRIERRNDYIDDLAYLVDRLRMERDAARAESELFLAVLRDRHPMVILAARWPGYVTTLGIGVLLGLLVADIVGAWA